MRLSKIFPEPIVGQIYALFHSKENDKIWLEKIKTAKKRVFIFIAGYYQNLGDMALTYSQRDFLKKIYPDAEIIVVPSTQTYQSVRVIKKHIRPDDVITTLGGGNMDDIYTSLEDARLYVVKNFPNNKIIGFPQTMIFSDTKFGQKRMNISRKVYKKHKDLTLFVREENSLARIKKDFPTVKIGYCPDIVLSLKKDEPKELRKNVLCCMRKDKELNISPEQTASVISAVKNTFSNVIVRDTVDIPLEACQPETFETTLEEFWKMVRTCKVVITDRLHCMIFCAITGTPVVVIDNSNKKISGVIKEWLSNVPWIIMMENFDCNKIIENAKFLYDNMSDTRAPNLDDEFQSLNDACK